MDKKKGAIVPNKEKDLCDRIEIRADRDIAPVDELLSAWFKRKVKELRGEEDSS
ncbi:MAG: hypothetical protein H0T62_02940 [Parachlamydiaceae bacterium]|nr:hypothetical protein [Parachlamydiaceae bacterium]